MKSTVQTLEVEITIATTKGRQVGRHRNPTEPPVRDQPRLQ